MHPNGNPNNSIHLKFKDENQTKSFQCQFVPFLLENSCSICNVEIEKIEFEIIIYDYLIDRRNNRWIFLKNELS